MRKSVRRRDVLTVLPLLLAAPIGLVPGCGGADRQGRMPDGSAPADSPVPLWQTATARVGAVQSSPPPVFHPFESAIPTPSPPALVTGIGGSNAAVPSPPVPAAAPIKPSGSQVLDRRFTSAALGREMPYFIYLPVGYAESGLRYPVLYMLHGFGGSNTEWIGYGLPETADTMMNAGQMPPTIIVLPQGDQAYWVNHADDGERWGDYTAQDVVQHIDATYRTIPDARHRAVGGLSMGAHAAMQLSLNYPHTFGVVGMHSPTLRDYRSMSSFLGFFGDEEYFNAHDPAHLVQQYSDRARELRILLDVGANDSEWHDSIAAFHDLLAQLNIPHVWHGDWPGVHDAVYWGGHCADYLRFYGAALAGT